MKTPKQTIFYSIEKTIKEYRKFVLKRIQEKFKDITVDQALLIQFLNDNPSLSQSEIAKLIFKDNASITRMIELMVKNKYLKRSTDINDRRKYKIELTEYAQKILGELNNIISSNREIALKGINDDEIKNIEKTLSRIIENCN
ncbi:MarR family winged helix-turn-helix transcriptional regulator [Lentimicrobium sp. S6]|uniref:MarR family winged helix-turn-helix transcriptional regulator n=1 Tax=Lentimicrobium sp. S6 TaxID=2735872 RepID=UPI001557A669|nr:MarR family transcriptional regulator [Lentimicrobium sp. S6]NPD47294.1 MarR family transcriptional regulator [Lentimicrobium sp. S6]